MATTQPDIHPSGDPGPPAPSGTAMMLPMIGFVSVVLLIVVALAPIGGWVGFAIALALLAIGVVGAVRYILRLASTGGSLGRRRAGDPASMSAEGLASAEGPETEGETEDSEIEDTRELEPSDLPLGAAARHEVVRRTPRPAWRRRPGGTGDGSDRDLPRRQRAAR